MGSGKRRGNWKVVLSLSTASVAIGAGVLWAWLWLVPGFSTRGDAAYARGDWREASSLAAAKLRTAPDDRDALRLLARASARMERDEVAQRVYGRIGVDRMGPEDLFLMASIMLRRKKTELAISTLELARQKDPDHPETLFELARLYEKSGRIEAATRLAERLSKRPGWEARGEVVLGLLLGTEHDPVGSATALDHALRLDPTLAGSATSPAAVRKLLARSLLQTRRPAEARRSLEAVLAEGTDPEATWLLSRAFLQEGDTGAAGAAAHQSHPYGDDHPLAPEPAPYVGSARCAGCHPKIFRTQQGSFHARTFRQGDGLRDLPFPGRSLPDPYAPRVVHEIRKDGGKVRVSTRAGGQDFRAIIEFALGSGDRGMTLLGRDGDGHAREMRLSHYHDGTGWGLTTGHAREPGSPENYLGTRLSEDERRQCVGCHTTNFRAVMTRTGPESADRGIGCERCHGPGGNHLKSVEVGFPEAAIARPRLASAEQITGLCGQCHSPPREPVTPSTPAAVRFQAATLTWSACYTRSQGAFSCTTCHNPHRDAESSASSYEEKCLKCHSDAPADHNRGDGTRPVSLPPGASRVACPVNPKNGCISCHMPTVKDAMPHSTFTDHHIRVHRAPASGRRATAVGTGG